MFVDHRQSNWSEWLATAEFAYNNSVQASTKVSPFMINYGMNPRMGFEPRKAGKHPAATEFVEKMKKIHQEAQSALKKAQDHMKLYLDTKRTDAPEYKPAHK